jgi:GGDEF domain-containing protein
MSEQQKKKPTLIDKMMQHIPAPPTAPAPSGPPQDVATTFDGNLSEKPIAYLLRAAEHYEITGKLFIGSVACNVCIQFGLGRAVHATSPLSLGTEAIMDLFIWKDGVIRFEPGGQPETVTVQESIQDIIVRGEAFIGNNAFLEENYINELSFLLRPQERLADGELEHRLQMHRVPDPQLHAEFYSNIYGTRNIKDTAEKMGLSHSQWVNIAADLLKLGLLLAPDGRSIKAPDPPPPMMQPPALPQSLRPPQIILPDLAPGATSIVIPETNPFVKAEPPSMFMPGFTQAPTQEIPFPTPNPAEVPAIFQPVQTKEIAFPAPSLDEWHLDNPRPKPAAAATSSPSEALKVGVPEEMLTLDPMHRNGIWLLLNKAETGILSFEALQFFLDREFARAFRFKTSLALALFCVTVTPDAEGNMPAEVCALITAAVANIKRDVDMFGHFGDRAFGLLLPGIESSQACHLADRINRDLVKMKPDLEQYAPCLHFGIASAPQDATDMEGLAKAAQIAMFIAALHNDLRVEANQVSNKHTQEQLSQGQTMGETMQLRRPTAEELSLPPQHVQTVSQPPSPSAPESTPAPVPAVPLQAASPSQPTPSQPAPPPAPEPAPQAAEPAPVVPSKGKVITKTHLEMPAQQVPPPSNAEQQSSQQSQQPQQPPQQQPPQQQQQQQQPQQQPPPQQDQPPQQSPHYEW